MTPARRLAVKKYRATERGKAVYLKARGKWWKAFRANLILKYGDCCVCCGESDIRFLTLDHKEGKSLPEKGLDAYSIYRRLERELDKNIQIMCWNCNCGRAANGGVCPHQDGKSIQNGLS